MLALSLLLPLVFMPGALSSENETIPVLDGSLFLADSLSSAVRYFHTETASLSVGSVPMSLRTTLLLLCLPLL